MYQAGGAEADLGVRASQDQTSLPNLDVPNSGSDVWSGHSAQAGFLLVDAEANLSDRGRLFAPLPDASPRSLVRLFARCARRGQYR